MDKYSHKMSTPPRLKRELVCPPAPVRPLLVSRPLTTQIFIMKIQMRKNGDPDEKVEDEEDQEEWSISDLYFASRDAMAHYFNYLYQSGGGNGFENAIIAHIEEDSRLDKFLDKIASMTSSKCWEINKNLNIYIYNNVLNSA